MGGDRESMSHTTLFLVIVAGIIAATLVFTFARNAYDWRDGAQAAPQSTEEARGDTGR
jgi:hypothetical protein